jgi:hypothetical protein
VNKTEDPYVVEKDLASNQQIADAISSVDSPFVSKTVVVMPDKEPELFPNHNPAPIVDKREAEPEVFIPSDNEPSRRRFTDWFTNRSIDKRNRQKQDARVQEPDTSTFSDDFDHKVNLEITAFFRRKS